MKNKLDSKENELEKKMLGIRNNFEKMEEKNKMYLAQLSSMHSEISQNKLYAENKKNKENKVVLKKIVKKI